MLDGVFSYNSAVSLIGVYRHSLALFALCSTS